jgi:cell division transport system permease protein
MFKHTNDIYFAGDDSNRFLPWLAGIMVFFASFLLCVGVSVGSWVTKQSQQMDGRFTVSIPGAVQDKKAIEAVEEALRQNDSVNSVERLSDQTLAELLSPWLGDRQSIENLPIPTVFQVELARQSAPIDYSALQSQLRTIAAGTHIDAQELWVRSFERFASAVERLMVIFAVLATCALAMMIAFTARAALKLHARTVQLLHSIGAEDRYVTRQFQLESLRLTAPGALGGSLVAAAGFAGLCVYIQSLDNALMPALTFSHYHAALLVVMPLACCALSWLVARVIVMQQLGRSL